MTLPVAAPPPTPAPTTTGSGSTGSTGSTGATSGAAAATQAGAQSLAQNQQTFLTLLTAQLKNQDPLSPMDPTQFTQQLVAMNGVQQQIVSNQLLQKLVDHQTSVGDPVNMIGKTVTAETPSGKLTGGQSSGWVYSLDAPAKNVTLQVYDSNNQLVSGVALGAEGSGEHAYSWNGKSLSGSALPDGVYTLKVNAVGADGKDVSSKVFQRGVVSSVETVGGEPMLNLNGLGVSMSAVTSVAANDTSSSSTTTTGQAAQAAADAAAAAAQAAVKAAA
jgi:flagellar basal-body rod modification protein FlgD